VTDRARYILDFYSRFLTPEEQDARLCAFLLKGGRDPKLWETERCTAAIESRLRDGPDKCLEEIAARVERDHDGEMYFHACPKCGGLCRTPKARQCFRCHHDWHDRPTMAPSATDSELGCITGPIVFAVAIPVFLLTAKFGDALFMRFFYGAGEHAPRLIDSKHGKLSDGHSIPALLDPVRIIFDAIPTFVSVVAVAGLLIGLKRWWANRSRA
jgi:hypothetical protein